jgi:hypothetical protein
MSFASVKVTKNFTSAQMAKQLPFAIASALTKTAGQARRGVIRELPGKFTIRTDWARPTNKFGIKIKPATKQKPVAEVGTDADWLEKFETGKDKLPRGQHLAIPTVNVRRTKRSIIQRSQRPNALRGKRTFILNTKSGRVLFQRKFKGKRSNIVALYNLERRARIRKNSPVIEPVKRIVARNLGRNFTEALANALKTAR